MQMAFYLAGEITQESIPWVRCASGNVFVGVLTVLVGVLDVLVGVFGVLGDLVGVLGVLIGTFIYWDGVLGVFGIGMVYL